MLQTRFIKELEGDPLSLSEAGGKAANLSALIGNRFPVPPGFVLLTSAYRFFVEDNDLEQRIEALLNDMNGGLLEPARVSKEIRSSFENAVLPGMLRIPIIKAYRKLDKRTRKKGTGQGELPVAVRSSATAEDMEHASFAGQQDTYLDVSGKRDLLLSVKRCWGSLWTERAMHYRTRNGISHDGLAMAVVVQQMIRSEFSGVLFTADPLTGNRKRMLLESSRGLGEALASGKVEPDRFTIDRERWEIEDRNISKRALGRGDEHLPDETILDVARLSERVERSFGSPQDIEWAYADGKIHVIQSRPITTLYPLPSPMPDWADIHLYVSFNAAEGICEPFTPMGIYALQRIFSRFTVRGKTSHGRKEVHPVFVEAGGRLYADVTMFFRSKLLHGAIDYIIKEFLSTEIDDFHSRLGKRKSYRFQALPVRQTLRYLTLPLPRMGYFPRAVFSPSRARERYLKKAGEFVERAENELKNVNGLMPLLEVMDKNLDLAFKNLILPAIPLGMVGAGLLTLAEKLTKRSGGPRMDMKRLMKGAPHNLTMDMNKALWSIAEGISSRNEGSKWKEIGTDDIASRYTEGKIPRETGNEIGDFLRDFGHRGPGELDLGRARWVDDPAPLFEMIRSYLSQMDDQEYSRSLFSEGARGVHKNIDQLLSLPKSGSLGVFRSRLLKIATRRIQALGGLREAPRFYCVRLSALYRSALIRQGEEMTTEGALEHPEDIFFLLPEELRKHARKEDIDITGLVKERKGRYKCQAEKRVFPLLLTSDGEVYYKTPMKTSGKEITCQPVSPGIARGRIRVIRDPGSSKLLPGEIIVCRATDPGWTPLFIGAGGLIMEIGGAATHGAIVAREFDLPAVAGFHNATVELKDGEEVMVDGTKGVVIRTAEKGSPSSR